MSLSNTPERTLLERKKSRIHDAMERSYDDLCDAVSAFHSLENHYDLSEQTIESVDGWVHRIDRSLEDVSRLIKELEDWAFDGDSHVLMDEDDLAEVMGYEGQKENYEDHKDKDE